MAQTKYADSVALQQMVDETKTRLANKVDKVSGKQLSTEDYTSTEKTKLAGIAEGAQVNVLEGIKVDNTDLTITDKKIALGKMALKDEIAKADLSSALSTEISGKADQATTYTKTEVDDALALKAPLASPTFTGTPTAPTATKGDSSTNIATTAYVQGELGDYVKSADLVAITAEEVTAMWA